MNTTKLKPTDAEGGYALATVLIFGVTGMIILLFVTIHVRTFKYGPEYLVTNSDIRDLYRLEVENFSSPLAVLFYIVAVTLVGFHLWHGVASAFQSLGADHPRYTPAIRWIGKLLAVIIAAGFVIIPLWVHFSGGRP
jgi:succinate dehydrogenase / fumarate reductase cytochrome b subunit